MSIFFRDLAKCFSNWTYWVHLSLVDISIYYRTKKLGFLWVFISSLLFVLVLGNLYHRLFDVSIWYYSVHLYFGLIIWNFISQSLTGGCNLINQRLGLLSSTSTVSVFDLVLRLVLKNFFILLGNFIPLMIITLSCLRSDIWLWGLPLLVGLILIIVFVMLSCLLFVFLSVFIPDLNEVVGAVLRIGFLATPIIWLENGFSVVEQSRNVLRYYLDFNPFYHLLVVARGGVFDQQLLSSYIIVTVLIFILLLLCILVYPMFNRKLQRRL